MILHLLSDDKFGDYAIHQFSEPEMCSEFVMIAYSSEKKYLKGDVKLVQVRSEGFQELKDSLGRYIAVVFHGLFFPWQESLLRSMPDHVKVAWVFWGGDIYGRKDLCRHFLSPVTKSLLWLHDIKRKQELNSYEIPFDLLQRIDYCLTDVPEDFVLVKQYFRTSIKELWYNYYSIEETLGDLVSETVNGSNILVGNSCTIECNHLDGFRVLKAFPLKDSKVVAPLSYGEPWLRNLLSKVGKLFWGSRFKPLVEFLPRDEYNRIIKSCAVAIMPHYRPQAFGNILTALWLGTRVYLSERNPLSSFFKRMGAVVFSIERDLKKSNPQALCPLSSEEIQQNRKAISAVYRKEVMHQKNLELVSVLNQ